MGNQIKGLGRHNAAQGSQQQFLLLVLLGQVGGFATHGQAFVHRQVGLPGQAQVTAQANHLVGRVAGALGQVKQVGRGVGRAPAPSVRMAAA